MQKRVENDYDYSNLKKDCFQSHLKTKHTKMCKKELAKRLMNDSNLEYASTFYAEKEDEFKEFIKTQKFDFSKAPGNIWYKTDMPIGIIMDKKYRLFESCVARLVVLGTPDDFIIVSAYPEHVTNTRRYKGKYAFDDYDFKDYNKECVEIFKLLVNKNLRVIVYKDVVKVFHQTVMRIYPNKKTIQLEIRNKLDDGKHDICSFKYNSYKDIEVFVELVRNYNPICENVLKDEKLNEDN